RYIVKTGDSLGAIASRFDTTLARLAHANRLDPAGVLLVGTALEVPGSSTPAQPIPTGRVRYLGWVPQLSRDTVRGMIVHWALHYGVDPRLARALAWQESGFQTNIVSPVGAWGVMQVTPQTWGYVERYLLLGEQVPQTVDGNVRVGVALLHHLL